MYKGYGLRQSNVKGLEHHTRCDVWQHPNCFKKRSLPSLKKQWQGNQDFNNKAVEGNQSDLQSD